MSDRDVDLRSGLSTGHAAGRHRAEHNLGHEVRSCLLMMLISFGL